jgi:hypothetical protein
MNQQQTSFNEQARRAFTWNRSALHEIHYAIGRAKKRRRPRDAVRIVYPSLPERKTWYECSQCGCEAYREDSRGKHCRLCESTAVPREWIRPDIAQAEERARWWRARFSAGQARYLEVGDAHPWKPLPEGEYRTFRKTTGPNWENGLARRVDSPAGGSHANGEPTAARRDGRDEP